MFNLAQVKATFLTADETVGSKICPEVYVTQAGKTIRAIDEGALPESLEGFEAEYNETIWVYEIKGTTHTAHDKQEAVDVITEYLANNVDVAAKLFA